MSSKRQKERIKGEVVVLANEKEEEDDVQGVVGDSYRECGV